MMDFTGKEVSLWRRGLLAGLAMAVAAAAWLPTVHVLFRPHAASYRQERGVAPLAKELAARHLALWESPNLREHELARMRASNAEWDFMGRTYLVLALSNMALREPAEKPRYLAVIDQILDETLQLEASKGKFHFMMDYARSAPFRASEGRSTFIDGEIALMLATRELVEPSTHFHDAMTDRIDVVVGELERGPVMCGESYPDECWLFCNAVAVAAVKVGDHVDGRDHGAFIAKWLETIKTKLVDPKSGLLVSSFNYDGVPMDGPEGSSIWMIAHCLQVVDPEFARQQYTLARRQIGREVLGFGYAREWPDVWVGATDVDSGPIVPVLGASAGSSGLALLGAASFGDDAYLQKLMTALFFAGFPVHEKGLSFAAGNQVGDAVLLYALVQGPVWEKAREVRQ